jgi:alpha-L-fucosidase
MLDDYQIDLGETELITGFTYTPTQRRYASGIISNYSFYGSVNGNNWVQLAEGEFSNIKANPIEQKVQFKKPFKAKYIKLKANKVTDPKEKIIIAEIGILTN